MTHGLDTSIVVATELATHSRHAICRALLERLAQGPASFAPAPHVLTEFYL